VQRQIWTVIGQHFKGFAAIRELVKTIALKQIEESSTVDLRLAAAYDGK